MKPKPIATERENLKIEVVGKRPVNEPYIWIGNDDGIYVDSLNVKEMRRLARAIDRALLISR